MSMAPSRTELAPNPSGRTVCALMLTFALVALPYRVFSQGIYWCPGDTPQIDGIASQTMATWPSDRTRHYLGAGEKVICSLNTGSYVDKDELMFDQRLYPDTIGTIEWSSSGGGGSIPPGATGAGVTMSSALGNGYIMLQARVWDSGTMFTEFIDRAVLFYIALPAGVSVALGSPTTFNYPATAGTAKFGAGHKFTITFLPPAGYPTVNFSNIQVRENAQAVPGWVWPNGAPWNIQQQYIPGAGGIAIGVPGNVITDQHDDGGPRPKSMLYDGNAYVAANLTRNTPLEFKNDSGSWAPLGITTVHSYAWYANFVSKTTLNGVASPLMGPWQ